MNVASTTREYLVLRISSLKEEAKGINLENSDSLAMQFARIEELKNTLTVLNGGTVPAFTKEVSNDI